MLQIKLDSKMIRRCTYDSDDDGENSSLITKITICSLVLVYWHALHLLIGDRQATIDERRLLATCFLRAKKLTGPLTAVEC